MPTPYINIETSRGQGNIGNINVSEDKRSKKSQNNSKSIEKKHYNMSIGP